MFVKREDLTPEWVENAVRRIKSQGLFEPPSAEEREASMHRILAQAGPGKGLWVFGYGSLMWNPMVHFEEQRQGRVYGHHRRYCFWARGGRATAERPGMGLGLDRGGSCHGMAFRIAGQKAAGEIELLWRREMISGVYLPRWVTVHTARGKVRALTFTANRAHSQYVGGLPPETTARHIAGAVGPRGTGREYLENTVRHLTGLGLSDRRLFRLHRLVCGERGD